MAMKGTRESNVTASADPGEMVVASWTEAASVSKDAARATGLAVSAAADAAEGTAATQAAGKTGINAGTAPKKKGKLLLIVVIVVLVLVGGYAFLALWPGLHTNTPAEESASGASAESTGSANAASADSANSSSSAGANYSTSEEPSFADFDWYLQLPRLDKAPSDGTQIKDFNSIRGGWKCMFLYDSTGQADATTREILNLYIGSSEGNFSVVLDLCKIEFGQEVIDESGADDIVLNGEWDGSQGTLTGTGSCKLEISTFYGKGDSQYALGRMSNASGENATVLMVRP